MWKLVFNKKFKSSLSFLPHSGKFHNATLVDHQGTRIVCFLVKESSFKR